MTTNQEIEVFLNYKCKYLLKQILQYVKADCSDTTFHYNEDAKLLHMLVENQQSRLFIIDFGVQPAFLASEKLRLRTSCKVSDAGVLFKRSCKQNLVSMAGIKNLIAVAKSDFQIAEVVLIGLVKPRQLPNYLGFLALTDVITSNQPHAFAPLHGITDNKSTFYTTLDPCTGRLVENELFVNSL